MAKKPKKNIKMTELVHTLRHVLMAGNTVQQLASKLYPHNAQMNRLTAKLHSIVEKHKRYLLNQGIHKTNGTIEQIYNQAGHELTDPKIQKQFNDMVREDQVLAKFKHLYEHPPSWEEFQPMIQGMLEDFHSMLTQPNQSNQAIKKYILLSINLLSNLVLKQYAEHVPSLNIEFYKIRNLLD
jgi:hypothetical protein